MQVIQINNIHHFDQIKTNWEQVYAADPHAHFFVSWTWLRGWFDITPFTWFVLAIRPDEASPYVAFLPLNIRLLRAYKFNLIRELRMGGKPLGGYTGFVCLPEYEKEAMATFAHYLQQLGWDCFQMEHVLDPRLNLFLEHFPQDKYDIRQLDRIPSTYIPLPDTWDQYLQNRLGAKTRQNLRRRIRQIERNGKLCVTHVGEDNLDSQIEAALNLTQPTSGPKPERAQNWVRDMLRYQFRHNSLWLTVLWDGQTPVSTETLLVDWLKKTVYGFCTGYDKKYAKLSPGTVIIAYSIQHAIEHGFQVYDFIMGEDDYKFSFGAKQRNDAVSLVIACKSLRCKMANVGLNLARQIRDLLKKRHL